MVLTQWTQPFGVYWCRVDNYRHMAQSSEEVAYGQMLVAGWFLPSDVCCFINPTSMNSFVISTINHRIQPLLRQLNAILGAPSCIDSRISCLITIVFCWNSNFMRLIGMNHSLNSGMRRKRPWPGPLGSWCWMTRCYGAGLSGAPGLPWPLTYQDLTMASTPIFGESSSDLKCR